MSQLPISVHVATNDHDWWDELEARKRAQPCVHNVFLDSQIRPLLADPALDWAGFGLEPRWVGYDTTDCAAALNPSVLSGQGATEFERFVSGAASRGETAVVISQIGSTDPATTRSALSLHDDSVSIPRFHTTIPSRPLGKGARVRAASHLTGADAQLAARLTTCQPPPSWRTLSLESTAHGTYDGSGHPPPAGTLMPIVETEMGEPVAAVWTSPDEVERRYLVPTETPWPVLLSWLTGKALPDLVPAALRRARRHMADDRAMTTTREQAAHDALAALDATYFEQHQALLDEQTAAQAEAATVRDGLLYGTGSVLVTAVTEALQSAGISVVDLDDFLGGTLNADLLCTFAGRARLVEVKSAGGKPTERIYDDLVLRV